MAANAVCLADFMGKGVGFVQDWLQEKGMEKLCVSFEGMYYI